MTSILWLRRDLRRTDHPALAAAADDGPVLPLFVLDFEYGVAGGLRGRSRGSHRASDSHVVKLVDRFAHRRYRVVGIGKSFDALVSQWPDAFLNETVRAVSR